MEKITKAKRLLTQIERAEELAYLDKMELKTLLLLDDGKSWTNRKLAKALNSSTSYLRQPNSCLNKLVKKRLVNKRLLPPKTNLPHPEARFQISELGGKLNNKITEEVAA